MNKLKIDYKESLLNAQKCIAELEQKNKELKAELTKKADTNHSLIEQMAKLEEENAELKKENKEAKICCDVRQEQRVLQDKEGNY